MNVWRTWRVGRWWLMTALDVGGRRVWLLGRDNTIRKSWPGRRRPS